MFKGIISNDDEDKGCNFGILRFVLAFAVVSAFFVVCPQQGLAKYRDPYQFTTLTGNVRFIYFKGTNTVKSADDETSEDYNGFRQIYSLSMRGKFLSRRLVVYDLGVTHTNNVVKSKSDASSGAIASSSDKSNKTEYHFSTTIIPKSAIPLTLYGSRSTEENTGTTNITTTTKAYGLDWSFKLRTLPEVYTSYNNSKTTGASGDSSMQRYSLRVLKDVGITKNTFNAAKTSYSSSLGDNTSATSLEFVNSTRFSRRTIMTANAAKHTTTNATNTGYDGTSADMHLDSTPGSDFNQRHAYVYRLTKGTSTTENSSYSGNVNYRFTDRLSTVMSLNNQSNQQDDATQSLRTNSMDMGGMMKYSLTRRLSWRVNGTYADERSNAADANATGLNWTKYKLTTGPAYSRAFKLFTLGLTGNVGYVVENSGDSSSTVAKQRGVTYGIGLSLSRIRLWDYVMMNMAYNFSQAKDSQLNSFTDTRVYSLGMANIAGRKYMLASANYSKTMQDSWSTANIKRKESYKGVVGTSTRYSKNTKAKLTVNRINSYSYAEGNIFSNQVIATAIDKQRKTFLGETNVDINLTRSSSRNVEVNSITSASLYSLKIEHRLLFFNKTKLGLDMKRFSNATNNELEQFNRETALNINHSRPLRGGSFLTDYSYRITKRQYLTDYEAYKTHLLKFKTTKAMLGGELKAGYSFSSTTGIYLTKEEKHTTHAGEMAMSKSISRNLSVQLFALMSRTTGTFAYVETPSVTELKGTVRYALRSWIIGAEYSNKVSKYLSSETITDNRVMLSLSRGFSRMW